MKWLLPFVGMAAFSAAYGANVPSQITFHKDVEAILENHCQECHRPGEIAPFSLLTYEQTRPWAKAIRADVLGKKMPPWFADPHYGHFSNDRSLSKEEVATITAWVDSGAKEGDVKDSPKSKEFYDGWNIPAPDLVISMKEPFNLPATGEVQYQYIVMPTQFTEDHWIQAVEARPSNREVVHHIVVFIRPKESKWLRAAQPGIPYTPPGGGKDFTNTSGGGSDILMIYTPGMVPEIWRPGLGKLIRAGSDLVFQVHYTTSGKATSDLSKIGLVFAREKPTERAQTFAASSLTFKIPPQDPNFEVDAKQVFPNGAQILSLFPHMHLRGKAFEYDLTYPDGRTETLLKVPKYDFFWQLNYKLDKPLNVPAGATIACKAWYDNSPNNAHNPDPAAEVRFGEQSREEMMFGFFDIVMPADMTLREFLTPKKDKDKDKATGE
jgi:hypothetical protein